MKKRIVSVILLLAMVLTLAACGGGDADKLVGTWKCEMDLADQINAEMGLDAETAEYLNCDSFKITVYLQFNSDGTFSMYADKDVLNETLEDFAAEYAAKMEQYLVDMVYEQIGVEMSIEDILAASGTTMEEIMAEIISDDMAEELAAGMEQEGNFEAKDGKLFTSAGLQYGVDPEVYETYTLNGTTLTVTGYVGDEADDLFSVYPMVFTKIG